MTREVPNPEAQALITELHRLAEIAKHEGRRAACEAYQEAAKLLSGKLD